METNATLRHLRISPRKVRLVADQIRGMKANVALDQLRISSKGAALPIQKLLKSAIANAEHNTALTKDTLRIKTITVDEGPTLERFRPRAFGRAAKIRKRTSHVNLVLTGTPKPKKSKPAAKKTAKPALKKPTSKKSETPTTTKAKTEKAPVKSEDKSKSKKQ